MFKIVKKKILNPQVKLMEISEKSRAGTVHNPEGK